MERHGKNGGKLKSFEPGQSGKQKGRPKGVPNAKTRMARFLELSINGKNPITKEDELFTVAELMDLQVISKAIKGDLQAWEKINDRLEGKAKQTTEHSGEIKQNINLDSLSLEEKRKALELLQKADLKEDE
jgi:hypothetical protein